MTAKSKYKLKHRPPPVTRLLKYQRLPPPMMDDPPERKWRTWEERCVAVYHWMIAQKRGASLPVSPSKRRGLWFWLEAEVRP